MNIFPKKAAKPAFPEVTIRIGVMKTHSLSRLKIADRFFPRLWGLMGRKTWPPQFDVLLFPKCGAVHTWFTFVNPDLIFVGADGTIVSIIPRANAWKFYGFFSARHCLEARPGFSKRRRMKVGDRVKLSQDSSLKSKGVFHAI